MLLPARIRQLALHRVLSAALGAGALCALLILLAGHVHTQDASFGAARTTLASVTGTGIIVSGHDQRDLPEHDPDTCPTCAAQSVTAQVATATRLPTEPVGASVVSGRAPNVLCSSGPPSSHRSRAPPAVS